MTFEQLRVLQAIVNEGTFRGAAEKLYKSQPAVSNLIKKLEQECGFTLFSRNQYRPRLTAEGRLFYEKALLALDQMNQLTALSKHMAKNVEPLVRIAVNAICPLPPMLRTLKRIETKFPVTQIDVATETMGGAIERLKNEEAEIAITTPTGLDAPRMEAVPFTAVRVLQVAHKDYPPARHNRINSAEDMRSYVQLVVADSSQQEVAPSLDVLQDARHWRVTDFATNKEIILSGMAWGAMPEHMVSRELAEGQLVQLHVAGIEARELQLYLIRRTDKAIGIVSEALWQALQKPLEQPSH